MLLRAEKSNKNVSKNVSKMGNVKSGVCAKNVRNKAKVVNYRLLDIFM